jgi:hypothetical protein
MKRKQKERIAIFIGLGVIAAVLAFMFSLQLQNTKAQAFAESYGKLVTDSRNLTQSYQSQVGKWKLKQYDNGTMSSITDQYLPKFQSLVDRAKALQPPQKYIRSRDLLGLSFQSEIESYKHFRNFLTTGLRAEDDVSTKFLSDALRYETDSFSVFNSAQ